jgi:hypothetical protein
MASRQVPYRAVLVPPRTLGVDDRRIAEILTPSGVRPAEPGARVLVLDGRSFTVVQRHRPLRGPEVDEDEALDRYSRPITVSEGMIIEGAWDVDPQEALDAGSGQVSRAIRAFWADHTPFDSPRPADAVPCPVRPIDGGGAVDATGWLAAAGGPGAVGGPDGVGGPAAVGGEPTGGVTPHHGGGEPPLAVPPALRPLSTRPRRRRRLATSIAVALFAGLLIVGLAFWWWFAPAPANCSDRVGEHSRIAFHESRQDVACAPKPGWKDL